MHKWENLTTAPFVGSYFTLKNNVIVFVDVSY